MNRCGVDGETGEQSGRSTAAAHALAQLREAYALAQLLDVGECVACLKRAGAAIAQVDDDRRRRSLQGEIALVTACLHVTDPDEFLGHLRTADGLLQGRSHAVPEGAPLLGTFNATFGTFNLQPGCADENAAKLDEAAALWQRMVGGGQGAALAYRAQLARYRGQLDDARQLAEQALDEARRHKQDGVALDALDVLASVAKHDNDADLWRLATEQLRALAFGSRGADSPFRVNAQVMCYDLDLSMGFLHSVPEWLRDGDFDVIGRDWGFQIVGNRLTTGAFSNALMVRIAYLGYSGRMPMALNAVEEAVKVFGLRGVLIDAYAGLFKACWFKQMGRDEDAHAALVQAVEAIAPDGLWLIAAEFDSAVGDMLRDEVKRINPQAAHVVTEMGCGFRDKLTPLRENELREMPFVITQREQEVATLLLAGKTNQEIAAELYISERTVKAHVSSIYRKFGIANRAQVAAALEKMPRPKISFWAEERPAGRHAHDVG